MKLKDLLKIGKKEKKENKPAKKDAPKVKEMFNRTIIHGVRG